MSTHITPIEPMEPDKVIHLANLLAEMQWRLERERNAHEEARAALEELESDGSLLNELKAENERLKDELERYGPQILALETMKEPFATNTVASLQAALTAERGKNKALEDTLCDLKSLLESYRSTTATLRSQVADLEINLEKANADLHLKSYKSNLYEDDFVDPLFKQNKDLASENAALKAQVAELEALLPEVHKRYGHYTLIAGKDCTCIKEEILQQWHAYQQRKRTDFDRDIDDSVPTGFGPS